MKDFVLGIMAKGRPGDEMLAHLRIYRIDFFSADGNAGNRKHFFEIDFNVGKTSFFIL